MRALRRTGKTPSTQSSTRTRSKPRTRSKLSAQKTPSLTKDEAKYLLETCEKLTNKQLQDFLQKQGLSRSGDKSDLNARIQAAIQSGTITLQAILAELDRILPWWRFHVYLYDAPPLTPKRWRDEEAVAEHLKANGLSDLLNAQIPIVLPEKLTLTSVTYSPDRLRSTAVQRREYAERDEELDPEDDIVDGNAVEFRAFVRQVARGVVSFEWDFENKVAMLQITELQSGAKYEAIREAFYALIRPWLDIKDFTPIDVSKAIPALHLSEQNDEGEVRSHGIEYRTIEGRRLAARSSTLTNSVLGEEVIDTSLDRIREEGVGHSGNFYWLPTEEGDGTQAELEREIHVIIIGDKNRVSMRTRSTTNVTEREMRHVLSRLRELSLRK